VWVLLANNRWGSRNRETERKRLVGGVAANGSHDGFHPPKINPFTSGGGVLEPISASRAKKTKKLGVQGHGKKPMDQKKKVRG